MLRWNPVFVRAVAAAAVVGLLITTVAGAFRLPGPALVVLVVLGVAAAVVAAARQGRKG